MTPVHVLSKTTNIASVPHSLAFSLSEPTETNRSREKHIQKKIKAELIDAKAKSTAKDKKGALCALKRKKMYEAEVGKINGARMTLENQVIHKILRKSGWLPIVSQQVYTCTSSLYNFTQMRPWKARTH